MNRGFEVFRCFRDGYLIEKGEGGGVCGMAPSKKSML